MRAAREAVPTDAELLKLLEQEIKELRETHDRDHKEWGELIRSAQDDLDAADETIEQLKAQNYNLCTRLDALEDAQRPTPGKSLAPTIPATLDGFEDWCRANLSGAVEVHNRAFQGAEKSQFEDSSLLYRALLLLRDHYVPMRRKGGLDLKKAFDTACRDLGLDEQPTFSGNRWGEEGQTYFIRYGSRKVLMDRHLKKGSTKNERLCFRLYFFWDDDNAQVVVGWLPSHLETRAT
ncbi:MAG: hypothetical protein EXQ89_04760 [Rhodospirillaceae bacterium]|nr:hypothetical protein [Rhodospirillaceae bacterium]